MSYIIPAESELRSIPQYSYTITPSSYNYGSITEGDPESTKTFIIENVGTDELSFTFTDSTNFHTNNAGFSLLSGETNTVTFSAKTINEGSHGEAVVVNEPNAGNKNIILQSNIIPLPQYQYSVTPLTWDFGTSNEGDPEDTKEFLITAEGTDTLNFTFTDSTNFETDNLGFSMEQGQVSGFTVSALTTNIGTHSETMSINEVNAGNTNISLQSQIDEVPFTSGETVLTISQDFVVPVGTTTLEYTIVAGGGGGGGAATSFGASGTNRSGAGGAGGMLEGSISNPTAGTYPIVVGAGGAGGAAGNTNGNNGSDSTAFGFTAVGGGAGGMISAGAAGGSGGGGYRNRNNVNSGGGAGTAGQGNAGAAGSASGAGGGGGAGGAASANVGGVGAASSINGVTYAAGGTGLNSGSVDGINAVANTGNGGGGAAANTTNINRKGGDGGSGVVILRWT